jgi:hypothetical protein
MRSPKGAASSPGYTATAYIGDMDHTHWRPACRMVHLTFERDASTIVDVDRGPYWYELSSRNNSISPLLFVR